MITDLDGFHAVRVTIPETDAETPQLTLFCPATQDEAAESYHICGLEAIINLRNAIDEEIARLGQRLELMQDDVPQ